MAEPGNPTSPSPSQELARQKRERAYRRARRKVRESAGEIKELNITAMMDMMTIILVFLLKSYSASSLSINLSEELKLPTSTTHVQPQDNISITISMREVAVNDRAAVRVTRGVIPSGYKGKADSFYVGAIYDALKKEVAKQKYIAQYNPQSPFTGRINVIADGRVPYRTLMEVLYTAGQAELGEYKFMVMKSE